MTRATSVEDRVRQAFRAVAAEPIAPPATDATAMAASGHGWKPPSHRRTGVLVGAMAVVVATVLALALAFGPRSAGPPTHSGPPPGGSGGALATLVPTSATATGPQLRADAVRLAERLHSYGHNADNVAVRGRSVVIVGRTRLPVAASVLVAPGVLQIRPVLCSADGLNATTTTPLTPPPAACSAPQYSLQAPNMDVNVQSGTSNQASIDPDPVLAGYATTTPADNDANPGSPVLVPAADPGDGGGGTNNASRYLLGPAAMDGSAIASAQATFASPQWVVDVQLTDAGSVQWDTVAQQYFHEILAIDVDGQVVSAPLTQPSQAAFASFEGKVQIAGAFTEQEAQALAADFNSGSLATPLQVAP